jgi:HD-GYP domain-containing protein (c-di-GMP phosphodiesterase class II)
MAYKTGIDIVLPDKRLFVRLDYDDTSHLYRSGNMGGLLSLHYYGNTLHYPRYSAECKARELSIGCSLHDIGKTKFLDSLDHWERLSEKEKNKIKNGHILEGARFLEKIGVDGCILDAVLHHHQRWNGENSYPFRLKGLLISTEGLITSLVDHLDSLVNTRRFKEDRKSLPPEDALRQIESSGEDMFGPSLVSSFKGLIRNEEKRRKLLGYLKEEIGRFAVEIPESFIGWDC